MKNLTYVFSCPNLGIKLNPFTEVSCNDPTEKSLQIACKQVVEFYKNVGINLEKQLAYVGVGNTFKQALSCDSLQNYIVTL